MAKPAKTRDSFTAEDAARLDDLLYPLVEHGGLPFEAVDGLLSSVAVAPEPILPSEWLPVILGDRADPWQNDEEMQVFTDLVMRLYNHIVERVVPEPDDATSLPFIAFPEDFDDMDADAIDALDLPIGGNWAVGFMIGVGLRGDAWDTLAAADEEVRDDIAMIVALLPEDPEEDLAAGDRSEPEGQSEASVDVIADVEESDEDDADGEERRSLSASERLEIISDLAAALHHMNRVRLDSMNSRTPVRRGIKVGRNDPCPCGSGQKFKKCHGASIN